MTVNRTETARKFLKKELEKLSEDERHIVERFIGGIAPALPAYALVQPFGAGLGETIGQALEQFLGGFDCETEFT